MDFATPLIEIPRDSAICDKVIYLSFLTMSSCFPHIFGPLTRTGPTVA